VTIVDPLAITTNSPLPDGTVGIPYSDVLTATGGVAPYTWSIASGSLPTGITLTGATGIIGGTPKAPGTFTFVLKVKDSRGTMTTQSCLITVGTASLIISTPSPLPGGTVGASFNTTLSASGGVKPYSWVLASGSLPFGLSLIASTGVIKGTPTSWGTFNFAVQVADSQNITTVKSFTLNIAPAPLVITTASPLSAGKVGTSYSKTLAASGGAKPYTWSVVAGSLPPGLVLTASSGSISGKPTTTGSFSFSMQVQDALGTTTVKDFVLSIQ
jgi:hypothetical protein